MVDIQTIKMLDDRNGSPDGVHVRRYEKGHVYDVPASLATAFVESMKVAIYTGARGATETPETPAPSDKPTPETTRPASAPKPAPQRRIKRT
jgi:hypothetical protein